MELKELTRRLGGFCWVSEQLAEHGENLTSGAGGAAADGAAFDEYQADWQRWLPVHREHVDQWKSLLPDSPALKAAEQIVPISDSWQEACTIYNANAAGENGQLNLAFDALATELLLGELIPLLAETRAQLRPVAEAPELRITLEILDHWAAQSDSVGKINRQHGLLLPGGQPLSIFGAGQDVADQLKELLQVVSSLSKQIS